MGKALYRKHRPRKLSEVVGQDHITSTLENAIKNSSFSHAYLFTGPKGVGKTTIARILAHEINGITYDNDDLKLDIIEIDAASNNRIDEIRDIREKLHIAPSELKYKVYIIDEVHMLTKQAFNALLKTLEEPPEHVIFILATTESHKIPDTIISRTQRFSFKPIENNDTISHLRSIAKKEGIKIEDSALKLLADHGRGSFRDSISMMDQISGIDSTNITREQVAELLGVPDTAIISQILQDINSQDVLGIFDHTQKLREKGISPSIVAKQLIVMLRNQLSSKNNVLNFSESVNLMKNLLPLTGNYGSFEALEIVLLDAIKTDYTREEQKDSTDSKNDINYQQKLNKQPITTEATLPMINYEDSNKAKQPTEIVEIINKPDDNKSDNDEIDSVTVVDKKWAKVLSTLKKDNNTLYGILRMAKIDESNELITLTFNFDFHKKQIEQSKNLNRLREIVYKIYGNDIKIIINYKKQNDTKLKISESKIDNNTKNDDLKSINNIFSGAELLES